MRTKSYAKEFKLSAIALYKSGKKQGEVCKELEIPGSTFRGWLIEFEKDKEKSFPGSGNIKASNEEIFFLKKQLEDMRLERDILKKAVAYFSKNQA